MNDLELLERLGSQLDPPGGAPPARLRVRVLSRLAVEPDAPESPRPARHPVRRTRLAWRLAIAGGLAAVLTAGLTVVNGWRPAAGPERHRSLPDHHASAPVDAAGVLLLAAAAAQADPFTPPRPDQYLFIEIRGSALSQTWYSIDGHHDDMVRFVGGEETRTPPSCQHVNPCELWPGSYRTDLPTDPDGMLAWLRSQPPGSRIHSDDMIFNVATSLLMFSYLAPPVKAAIYQALAKVPGVALVHDVTDRAGRHGMEITRPYPDSIRDPRYTGPPLNESLIFDANTYAFLGTRTVALLREAIVDRIGQVP